MKFRLTLLITSLQTTSLSWIFLIITGLIDNCIFAENSIYPKDNVNYVMENSSEITKSIPNSSTENLQSFERRGRILHNLEYPVINVSSFSRSTHCYILILITFHSNFN